MRRFAAVALPLLAVAGCLARHVVMEIPPPGGCDVCHREKIASGWELAIAPIPLGREGGVPEDTDIVLRELQRFPYHKKVPSKRLTVFAAAVKPEAVGDQETGVQCFVCHRSPGPPHEKLRGQFPHPWGNKSRGE
jgi:hypothetical protein